jgi:hypothetical protein
LPAAAAYLAGWLPSVWFWWLLMRQWGTALRFRDAARAYYCGHLGKYIPGKATVLVIRAALMKERGFRAAPAALTVAYETLVMMGTGVAIGVALSPLLLSDVTLANWPGWIRGLVSGTYVPALVVAGVTAAGLPLLSMLFTHLAYRMTPQDMLPVEERVKIDVTLLASGLVAFVGSWILHGLSLGLTFQAVSGRPLDLADWPVWTGAAALATALGFAAVFAPGGVGVREWFLIETLRIQPNIGPQQAVAAAFLLRVVWFAAEIGAAAVLYYMVKPRAVEPCAQLPN